MIFYSQPTLPSLLVGDPTRLGQIILNLVNNAIKFTDRGEVVVRLEGRYVQEQRVELAISVRDTGIGLTQEQIGRLFRSFQQADQSTTRRYGGTGLGLAISKELVEAMGGRISVQSLPACGSTFAFTVSLELPSSENTPLISHPNLSGRRVMIVDDNPTMRNILSEQLLNSSAEVYCAASTDEALKLLATAAARGNPACDLVLLDTCLPGENALDAARALSERFSPAICLLSGQLGQSMTPTAQAVGIRHFLTKPITPQGLQKLLAEVFFCGPTDWNSVVIAANSQSVPNLTGTTILVAEDNEINQQVVCEILEAAGASCDIAVNGREAVRLALDPARRYDLLLMDLQMPELDGFEATREIRRHLAADELSLVALTAHSLESERLLCLELGMNDYLTKPIDPVKLLTTVAHWTDAGGSIKPGVPDVFPAVLPGFEDLQGALLRMNGNAALLRRLLAAFHARFADFSTEFQTALESGDHLGVLCIVHNLRGVSSTLGAMSIAAMATECEQVLRRNNGKNLRPDLALSLMASLEPALKTSFKFRQEIQEEILRTHANPGPAIEEAEFESMLQNLNTLTQNRNLKAREVFARLRTTIAEHVGSELAEELHFAFDKFNYDVALRLLEHLEILLRRGSALSKMP